MTVSHATDGPPVRVFVGLSIVPDIARELDRLARVPECPTVRPMPLPDIHLTLVPPWEEPSPSEAIARLGQVARKFGPFPLSIQHVRYGPDLRRPRLLWADCAVTENLMALREALLQVYGRTDDRPFRPHVTLARIRGSGRTVARKHPIDQDLALTQPVESIELFRSPASGEKNYRILATRHLGSPQSSLSPCSRSSPERFHGRES